jgi:hypothetical protein
MDSACPSVHPSVKRDDRNHAVEMTAAADITASGHITYGTMNDIRQSDYWETKAVKIFTVNFITVSTKAGQWWLFYYPKILYEFLISPMSATWPPIPCEVLHNAEWRAPHFTFPSILLSRPRPFISRPSPPHSNLFSSVNVRDHLSHPYTTVKWKDLRKL